MQIQIWQILNYKAKQNWTKTEQAEKFVAGMLKIREREELYTPMEEK